MTNGVVYLDEAGNTGLNFLDPSQPTFVLAGWFLPADAIEAARSVVNAISSESGSSDMKGSRMMHTRLGRGRVDRLVGGLLEVGCCPAYALYEKRYAVAAKIVETFLDPEYNDHLLSSFEADVFEKQALAQRFFDLPDGSLTPAWNAIRMVNVEQMRRSLDSLIVRCGLLQEDDLAYLLAGARRHLERNAAALEGVRTYPGGHLGEGLPATSLAGLAGAIDTIAPDFDLTCVEIVHDETSSFQSNLEWSFQMLSGPEPAESPFERVLPHGGRLRIGYSVVRNLRFAASQEEPLIQAADILAALLATVPSKFLDTIEGTNRGLADQYAYLALLADLGHPVPCDVVASKQFIKEIAGVVERSIRRQARD